MPAPILRRLKPRWGLRRRTELAAQFLRNLLLDPLSGLMPRSARRWVFGYTGELFADNPKYLFLWMRLYRPDIDVRWISGSFRTVRMLRHAGHPAHWRWSPAGMFAAARARVWIFAHGLGNVNAGLGRGAFLVNLWHGVGLKTIHLGHAGGNTAAAARNARRWFGRILGAQYLRPYDLVVTTSDAMEAHFAQQLALPPERCPQIGYPRLDVATDAALAAEAFRIDRGRGFVWPNEFAETWIYLPTFRDTGRPFFSAAIPDIALLSEALRARNALMWIKPHPRTVLDLTGAPDNIRVWPQNLDFNLYLGLFQGLITDYSSVLYDWLRRRDCGIILYTFDLDEYLANDRSFVMPYDDHVAGVRVKDFGTLCQTIRSGSALSIRFERDAARLAKLFWGGSYDPASPEIVRRICSDLGLANRVTNRSDVNTGPAVGQRRFSGAFTSRSAGTRDIACREN